jgi:hypothetical protein
MNPHLLAATLLAAALAVVVPTLRAAFEGVAGLESVLFVLPVLPLVACVVWYFLPWAFREDDAQLMQLLSAFECPEAISALRDAGVKTTNDLEFVSPEKLEALRTLSVITRSKLEDVLRCVRQRSNPYMPCCASRS